MLAQDGACPDFVKFTKLDLISQFGILSELGVENRSQGTYLLFVGRKYKTP